MQNQSLENVYKIYPFANDELDTIIKSHHKIELKKGDFFLQEGEISDGYLILESGLMRSFVHDFNKNDITTNFFSNDEIVIEVSSLFQRIKTKENIQALSNCVCWKIDFDVFQKLYHSINNFSEWGRAWMSNELFNFKQRSVSIITDSATDRYQTLIKNKPQVILQAPLKCVATYLGVTNSSLSRIRKEISRTELFLP
jgi:CRP/FNR family transcriptional regulator, anaerobic regulatory protein